MQYSTNRTNRRNQNLAVGLLRCASKHIAYTTVFLLGILFGRGLDADRSLLAYNDCIASPSVQERQSTENTIVESNDGWKTINVFYGSNDSFESMLPDNQHFFSQARQDEVVLSLLRNKTNGYFVDLAANDATVFSNSYALERHYGWKGLCIEPNPMYWYNLTHARKNCELVGAVVGKYRMDEVNFLFKDVLGGIVGPEFDNKRGVQLKASEKKYTVTLSEIFTKFNVPRVIDYLSLDVEGAEEFIMSSFPLEDYRIRILTIERPQEGLRKILESHGYINILRLSHWGEQLWIHESFQESMDMTHLEEYSGRKQRQAERERKKALEEEKKKSQSSA